MKRTPSIICLAALFALVALGTAMTGQEALQRIRRAYGRIDSFQARFEQTFVWKLAGTRQTMHGRFFMKKPNRFRIQTDVQTVVTDGKTVWSYSPATRQVIVNDYDPATMPLRPDNFLFAFPDERSVQYVGEERLGEGKCHVLDVAPKDTTLGIRTMRVWVDARTWVAKQVRYVSIGEDTTTYVLTEVRLNPRLPDSLFTFSPPPEVEVVDFRRSASQ